MIPPFQRLLDDHGDDLYRFLLAAGGPADADDLFQETVVAALRAYPRLRYADNLRSWLLRIAHRKMMDAARRRGRGPLPYADVPDRPIPSDDGTGEVWALVRILPPKQRGAVYLHYAGGLKFREVGTVLGCTEEAARRSAHEGVKKLRALWEKEGSER